MRGRNYLMQALECERCFTALRRTDKSNVLAGSVVFTEHAQESRP